MSAVSRCPGNGSDSVHYRDYRPMSDVQKSHYISYSGFDSRQKVIPSMRRRLSYFKWQAYYAARH
jgi:hypothetical protein